MTLKIKHEMLIEQFRYSGYIINHLEICEIQTENVFNVFL